MKFYKALTTIACLLLAFAAKSQTINVKTSGGTDDAEEYVTGTVGSTVGTVDITSSDLELMTDSTNATTYKKQLIGIRFPGINIPKGAVITGAYIQFAAKGDSPLINKSGAITLRGEASSNAAAFAATAGSISARTRTTEAVTWTWGTNASWGTSGNKTADQRTADFKYVIQEIVNQSGWASGNALALIFNGEGVHNVHSANGAAANLPELIITYTQLPTLPEASKSLQFNGTNAYATFGTNSKLQLPQFTLECWFKRVGTGVTGSSGSGGITAIPLITKGRGEAEGSTVDCNYFFGINGATNTLAADFEEGAAGTSPGLNHPIIGTTVIALNTWYHAAVTYDGTKWRLYLNGVLDKEVTVSQPVQGLSIQHAAIGSALNSTGATEGFFNGIMDEVRVWKTARTEAELQGTINNQLSSAQTNMVARWGLNEGSGTTIFDFSGNNVTGFITGANFAWSTDVAPYNLTFNPNKAPLISGVSPIASETCLGTGSTSNINLSVNVSDQNSTDVLTVKFYGKKKKKTTAADFTLIGLPDTQFYTQQPAGASNITFKAQTSWIAANRANMNIAHVAQLGDCVQNGDNGGIADEWKRADTAMKIIEDAITTGLADGVPYTMNVGNHDQSPAGSATGTTTFFNQYFGTARFGARSYWGGNYGSNADNSYQLFSASGIDFLVVSLEYDEAANAAVLTWADGILKTYPNRKAIIVSHWIINSDNTFGAQGQKIYDALKNNSNLFLMLCGHVNPNGEARRSDTFNGNTVHTLLSDYQDRTAGGNGWLRIMTFSPANNTIAVKTYSPTLNQFETDANSEFTLTGLNLSVDNDPFELLSTQTITGSGTLNYNWMNLDADNGFEWYATVSDAEFTNTTSNYVFSTYRNPSVELGSDKVLDCGQTATLDAGNPGYNYLWSSGETSQTISVSNAGKFWVKVTSTGGSCVASDTVSITKTPIISIGNIETEYRVNDPKITLSATPSTGLFSGPGVSGSEFNPAVAGVGGPYTITYSITNGVGCVTTASKSVSVLDINAPIISNSGVWKYLDNGSNQGTAWFAESFDDSNWAQGPAELGYGDSDEATVVNGGPSASRFITTYFRKTINIADVNAYTSFKYSFRRDDGVVVYVNGTELFRDGMAAGTVTSSTLALNAADDGATIITKTFTVPNSLFKNGKNVVAAEIHQTTATSSDITWILEVVGKQPGSAALTRGPYLQTATSNSIVLRWRTDDATDSKVAYGTAANNLSLSASDAVQTTEHTIKLTGLTPYTKYYYSIGSSTFKIQGDGENYFVTSPEENAEGKYSFWVAGDCGTNQTNQRNVRDKYISYMGDNVTNGWLLLGDNAYNSGLDGEFSTGFFAAYQDNIMKHAPLWPAPGNHDYANSGTIQDSHDMPYYSIFDVPTAAEAGGFPSGTEAFYSYDYGNIHFMALDSYGEEANKRLYDMDGAQVTWIKNDLAANTQKWTIAYWHHPPYTMGSHNSDTESELVKMRTNFISLLENNGVDLILCGHSHDYERSKLMKGHYGLEATFNEATHNLSTSSGKYDGSANSCTYLKDSLHTLDGTVYVVAGSAGQLSGTQAGYPHNALPFSNASAAGSLVLEFDGNRLDAKFVTTSGSIGDKFTIIKDGSAVKTFTIDLGDTLKTDLEAKWSGNYKWSHTSSNDKKVSIATTSEGTYVVSDLYECLADTFKVKVRKPTIKTTFNKALCGGESFQYNFTTTGKFFDGNNFKLELSDANGSFASPVQLGTSVGTASGSILGAIPSTQAGGTNYKIRVRSTSPEFIGDSTAVFAINPKPTVSFLSFGAMCMNDASITLTAATPAGGTYSGNGVVDGVFSPKSAGAGNTTISYDYTDSKGCSASTSVQVLVKSNPVVSLDAFAAVCDNEASFTLSGGNPESGTYQVNGSNASTFNPQSGEGNYSISYTISENGCSSSAVQVLVVKESTPLVVPSDISSCFNDQAFTISGFSPSTAVLSGDGIIGTSFNPSTAGAGEHVITLSYTNENSCSTSGTFKATVKAVPTLTVEALSGLSTCIGGTVLLSATSNGMLSWIKDGEVIVDASSNTYSASISGNYTVSATSDGCSVTSSPLAVVINALPVPVINYPEHPNFCVGSVVQLSTQSFESFQWSINGETVTGALNSTIDASAAGNYTVTVKDNNGCVGTSAPVAISGSSQVVVSTDKPTTICPKDTISLKSSTAASYQWYRNGEAIATEVKSSLKASMAGSYYVVAKDELNCSATSATVEVNLFPSLPETRISIIGGQEFCGKGGNNKLISVAHYQAYQWYRNGEAINGANFRTLNNYQGGDFTVLVTDENNCSNTSPVTSVMVYPLPDLELNVSNYNELCLPDTLTIAVKREKGTSYQWLFNGENINGENSTAINISATGVYKVSAVSDKGCSATSDGALVWVKTAPDAPIVTLISTDVLHSDANQGNQWYRNQEIIPGAVEQNYRMTSDGLYTVRVTSSNGCYAESQPFSPELNGIDMLTSSELYLAYPNPFTKRLTIIAVNEMDYQLFDNTGRKVASGHLDKGKNILDFPGLTMGVYQLVGSENQLSVRLIKE